MQPNANTTTRQFTTFLIGGLLYGVDVSHIQEVVKAMPMTRIPLAPGYITGLINLRGQVATALGMRELFALSSGDRDQMLNVVCKAENTLVSLLVDEIGDVVEVSPRDFEVTPRTVTEPTRGFLAGVYKSSAGLFSVIDIASIARFIGLAKK